MPVGDEKTARPDRILKAPCVRIASTDHLEYLSHLGGIVAECRQGPVDKDVRITADLHLDFLSRSYDGHQLRSGRTTNVMVSHVTRFTDWLVDEAGINSKKPFNPSRPATIGEQLAFWRAWQNKNSASLLEHLGPSKRQLHLSKIARETPRAKESKMTADPPEFPEAKVISVWRVKTWV